MKTLKQFLVFIIAGIVYSAAPEFASQVIINTENSGWQDISVIRNYSWPQLDIVLKQVIING